MKDCVKHFTCTPDLILMRPLTPQRYCSSLQMIHNLKASRGSNLSDIRGPARAEVTIKPRQPDSESPILTTKSYCFSVVLYTRAYTPFQGLPTHTCVSGHAHPTQTRIKHGHRKLAALSPSEGPKPSAQRLKMFASKSRSQDGRQACIATKPEKCWRVM